MDERITTRKVKAFCDECIFELAREINEFVCDSVQECQKGETFELVDIKFDSCHDQHYALVIYLEGKR